jgi:mono/diheme cytochrome c family protein
MRSRVGLIAVLGICSAFAWGSEPLTPQGVPISKWVGGVDQVRRFFEEHCIDCHGKETAKAGLRLDTLADDFSTADTARRWTKVFDRVETGEMPPKKRERPPKEDRQRALAWIAERLSDAEERRERPAAHSICLRRLTRLQYENTVHDLLAVEADLKERLPEDPRRLGFDNVGEALQLSSAQLEAYLEAADEALDEAFVRGPQPKTMKQRRIGLEALGKENEGVALDLEDAAVLFTQSRLMPLSFLGSNHEGGRYRIRASVYAYQSGGKPVEFAATIHWADGSKTLIGYFDAPPESPAVVEFACRVDPRAWIECKPYHFPSAPATKNLREHRGPGLAVQWLEVEGPLGEWPPASHRLLFGDLPLRPSKAVGQRLPVVSSDPMSDADRLLRAFLRRAYRRAVTPDDLRPFLKLLRRLLDAGQDFEGAIRAAYKAILCSPGFLFLQDKRGARDEFALAARLSYFLWNTTPDEELLTLAGEGSLSRPETLRAQVERLLQHPKAQGFIQNFVAQWLELRLMDATTPDKKLYPEFDLELRDAMKAETELFIAELLRRDLGVANLVDSDFSFLNERLARHYGIDGVFGSALRPVKLPPGAHRGGVLTQASVLKVTANGTTTSPVYRGVWVLRNILGRPPDPPPPNAGAIEPDIRGAKTIREQLAKHRQAAACASCHVTIDPPGFALENFDVIGGWREKYRVIGGQNATLKKEGPKVEAASVLPDGRTFRDIDELKKLLLENKTQVARCLTEKLLVYATGRPPRFSDRAVVDDIVARIQARDYGLRSLVHEVVQSRIFTNP